MRALNRRTLAILQAAERSGDHQTALNAIAQARKNLELCARLSGELTPAAASDSGGLQVTVVYAERSPPVLVWPGIWILVFRSRLRR